MARSWAMRRAWPGAASAGRWRCTGRIAAPSRSVVTGASPRAADRVVWTVPGDRFNRLSLVRSILRVSSAVRMSRVSARVTPGVVRRSVESRSAVRARISRSGPVTQTRRRCGSSSGSATLPIARIDGSVASLWRTAAACSGASSRSSRSPRTRSPGSDVSGAWRYAVLFRPAAVSCWWNVAAVSRSVVDGSAGAVRSMEARSGGTVGTARSMPRAWRSTRWVARVALTSRVKSASAAALWACTTPITSGRSPTRMAAQVSRVAVRRSSATSRRRIGAGAAVMVRSSSERSSGSVCRPALSGSAAEEARTASTRVLVAIPRADRRSGASEISSRGVWRPHRSTSVTPGVAASESRILSVTWPSSSAERLADCRVNRIAGCGVWPRPSCGWETESGRSRRAACRRLWTSERVANRSVPGRKVSSSSERPLREALSIAVKDRRSWRACSSGVVMFCSTSVGEAPGQSTDTVMATGGAGGGGGAAGVGVGAGGGAVQPSRRARVTARSFMGASGSSGGAVTACARGSRCRARRSHV